ncbi:MAG TPA: IS256 family transposase [Acidimicrobiales bacterium]|nr:IS256 family transposase [Acidimicrobiales bacterium]
MGRDRYARGERSREGSRNGYCPTTIKTTAGPVTLERPKLRGTDAQFASRLLGTGVCRTNALESLVIAGFVRGLSVRDVEATLAEALGPEAALSKSTVSRICEAIKTEFDTWRTRDLSGLRLDYLFLDGSHFKFHAGARSEPVLAAWGITTDGSPVLVALSPGSSESHDAWADFLNELLSRGLTEPLLVISDGAPGLIGAAEVVLARSLRQRCLIHRCRNVLAKVPKAAQAEVKAEYWKIFDIDATPGQSAVDEARRRIARFEQHYESEYPAAVKCLVTEVDSLTVYLRFPKEHWSRIRHSNFIERTFGETRRRVKVIGRLPGERSCLSLVWAVLDRASRGWRGVKHTPATTRLLADLRRQLLDPPVSIAPEPSEEVAIETVTAVA